MQRWLVDFFSMPRLNSFSCSSLLFSLSLSAPPIAPGDPQFPTNRALARKFVKFDASVMHEVTSREASEECGSDGRGGAAAAKPTDLDLENLENLDDDAALSSPPVPAAPEPHAALSVICRKAATEAVSLIASREQPRENNSSDLEATLALGRLAVVLTSSSSSSPSFFIFL